MGRIKQAVIFVDGLDHDFVLRARSHAGLLRSLFPPQQISRIQGVLHSLQSLGQMFAGRHLELFQFQGHRAIPETDRIINWDALLSHVPEQELLWNRLNRHGHRVGLMEMLGVFLSPALDGFSVTKNLSPLGLTELFNRGLSHHPRPAGKLYSRLAHDLGYPRPPRYSVPAAAGFIDGQVEELTDEQAREIIERQGCHRLLEIIDENLTRLFKLLSRLTDQHPVDALFMHTGYFDILLHLFWEQPEFEARIAASLDLMLELLLAHLEPDEILIFSDHGMRPSSPHLAQEFLHRTCHRHDTAVVMGSGPLTTRYLRENPPRDLTAIYHGSLAVFGAGGDADTATPPTRAQVAAQMEQTVQRRDQLLEELSRMLEKEG